MCDGSHKTKKSVVEVSKQLQQCSLLKILKYLFEPATSTFQSNNFKIASEGFVRDLEPLGKRGALRLGVKFKVAISTNLIVFNRFDCLPATNS